MDKLIYAIPFVGVIGLIYAIFLAFRIGRYDKGNERMREISAAIHDGAKAFLFAEYKILIYFILVLFVAIGVALSWITAASFVLGAL